MTLKEAIQKYKGFTIYTSRDKFFKEGLRLKELLECLGKFDEKMKPVALYLSEIAEDEVYLLYKEPKKRKRKLNKLEIAQIE